MIEAHALDAWTAPASRRGPLFRDLTVLGGFAAPLFLMLAGLAIALSAARVLERTGSRRAAVEAVCQRGVELFLLAFLFRLQAFIVSPGSYPVSLFRVDILNIMGPAMVATGLLWGLLRGRATAVAGYVAAALAVALAAPVVRASPHVDLLPLWLQWYVRPWGDFTTFTLFPWIGFAFIGGACGILLAPAHDARDERRVNLYLAVAGILVAATGWYTSTRPTIYRASSFWTTSPSWFLIRAGAMLIFLTALYVVSQWIRSASLERLGRNSLFVYWIHVELVYGYATWLIHGRLPLWGTALGFVILSLVMYRAIAWRDRLVEAWRHRRLVNYQKPVLP